MKFLLVLDAKDSYFNPPRIRLVPDSIHNSIEEAEKRGKERLGKCGISSITHEGFSIWPLRDGVYYTPSVTKTYDFPKGS